MIRMHRVSRPRRADSPRAFSWYRLRGAPLSQGAVTSIANAIQNQEGYYPGSLSFQNNNPGNLVYAGQPGATLGPGGFAVFASYADGYSAMVNQIQLDATRGSDVNGNPINTVGDLIGSWAPASAGNDTSAYIASVENQTGFNSTDALSALGDGGASSAADFSADPGGDTGGVVIAGNTFPWWSIAAAGFIVVLVLKR